MSKPVIANAQWDTNQTHVTATAAGHKTDGYATNEVPTSDQINYLWNQWYQWLAWLDQVNLSSGTQEIDVPAAGYQADNNAGGSYSSVGYWSTFTGAGTVVGPVVLPVGARILTAKQFYNVNGTAAGLTPAFKRMDLATGTVTPIWTGSLDNTGSAIESQISGTLNHTVVSGSAYYFEVTVTNAGHRVHGGIITYDQIAA